MNLYKRSIQIIKENQAETGAFLASPSLSVYKYSWFRDGSWIAYSMHICRENKSAEKFHDWASNVIIRHKEKVLIGIKKAKDKMSIGEDFIHPRYTVEGEEGKMEWGNFQLDGLGVWLWTLSQYIKYKKKLKKTWIEAADIVCDYLKELWNVPCYDLWEENPGKIHTSTLASIYSGLLSFTEFFPEKKLKDTCIEIKQFILENLIYKGRLIKYLGSIDVDSSLIMCSIPFKVFYSDNPIMIKTVSKIIKDLKVTKGLRRYKDDTYYGGGEWILLSCWLGLFYLDINKIKKAIEVLKWVEYQAGKYNYLPEQINPVNNEKFIEWSNIWGKPANPLLWSHAMYLILKNKTNNHIYLSKMSSKKSA